MWRQIVKRLGLALGAIALSATLSVAQAWKDDFDRICGQADNAEGLSKEQLQALVKDSDDLLKRLEQITDPSKKVYIQRIQKCRGFFLYMMERAQTTPAK